MSTPKSLQSVIEKETAKNGGQQRELFAFSVEHGIIEEVQDRANGAKLLIAPTRDLPLKVKADKTFCDAFEPEVGDLLVSTAFLDGDIKRTVTSIVKAL